MTLPTTSIRADHTRAVPVFFENAKDGTRRVHLLAQVCLREGPLESLPVRSGELDAAILSLVLTYVPDAAAVLRRQAIERRLDEIVDQGRRLPSELRDGSSTLRQPGFGVVR